MYKCDICRKKFVDDRIMYQVDVTKINPKEKTRIFNRKKKVYICQGCVEKIRKLGRIEDVVDRLAAEVYGDIDKRVRKLEQHVGMWDEDDRK